MSESVIEKIEYFLQCKGLCSPENTLIVGFSGGEDSSCLLSVLALLSKKYKFKLVCAHLNHNWRGEEALAEQKNSAKIAQNLGVEFYTETLDEGLKCTESTAREARYEFFARCANKYNTKIVLTAHTQTDNVETVLYRIIKGTGILGLCGIPESRELDGYCVYRPMLDITRDEVIEYNKLNVKEKNCDSSNFDTKYARNNIRLELIPQLQKINPDVQKAISELSSLAEEETEIVNEYIAKVILDISDNGKFLTKEFFKLSLSVQKKLIYEIVRKCKITYDRQDVEELYDFVSQNRSSTSGKMVSVTTNNWLFVSKKYIYLVENEPQNQEIKEIQINSEGTYVNGNYELRIEKVDSEAQKNFIKSADTCFVDLSEAGFPLQFRGRNQNTDKADVIVPCGFNGHQKLKKYLSGKDLNKFEKSNILLLCKDEDVLLVLGVGMSDKIKVRTSPTHKITFKRIENG